MFPLRSGTPRDLKIRYTEDMDYAQNAGYQELEHTADWELLVWAPDLAELLRQAARGMYALSDTRLQPGEPQTRQLRIESADRETLLVSFLAELLYFGEVEGLAFDQMELHLDENCLQAELLGSRIEHLSKEIKAVTYHRMQVRETGQGLAVNIVFDV